VYRFKEGSEVELCIQLYVSGGREYRGRLLVTLALLSLRFHLGLASIPDVISSFSTDALTRPGPACRWYEKPASSSFTACRRILERQSTVSSCGTRYALLSFWISVAWANILFPTFQSRFRYVQLISSLSRKASQRREQGSWRARIAPS
jgi:hypothetical protein